MATKYQAQRESLASLNLWQWLTNAVTQSDGRGGLMRAGISLMPVGNYAGDITTVLNPQGNTVLTNPWGVEAQTMGRPGMATGAPTFRLAPGQSVDFSTGRLSDPNLHAGTAAKLNQAMDLRAVQAVGLQQAQQDSARKSMSVLATLDQMYFGNVNTSVPTGSTALTGTAQAKQQGFNTSNTKTILGTQRPAAAAPVSNPYLR
jgi:hypothetical protein